MMLCKLKPALLLVDVQQAFLNDSYWGGNRNNKDAEVHCGLILRKWRELNLPIFHIRHSSTNPKSLLHETNLGFQFHEEVTPLYGEPIVTKKVNSSFIGTNLKKLLDEQNISTLVVVGITTNHCVSTTVRMAGNYGYKTYTISDATATFDRIGINGELYNAELIHLTALANLNEEFATVCSTSQLLEML